MGRRGSGILLHITSLPSSYGIGDFGREAYWFVDILAENNQSFWQILPLNQTCAAYGNSPYSSFSAYAGNTILISPDVMVEDGILLKSDIEGHPEFSRESVDYRAVTTYKEEIFRIAFEKNKDSLAEHHEFNSFCNENHYWLEDYSLFISIKKHFNNVDWSKWPEYLRDRREEELKEWKERLQENILRENFLQYIF